MGGVVADVDLRSLSDQGRQDEGLLGVGPADRESPSQHHPGNTGHSRATDGDEVDRPQTAGGRNLGGEVETAVRTVGGIGIWRAGPWVGGYRGAHRAPREPAARAT